MTEDQTPNEDPTVCFCYRVSRAKVAAFLRKQNPAVASQLSEGDGAGTGRRVARGDKTKYARVGWVGANIGAERRSRAPPCWRRGGGRHPHERPTDCGLEVDVVTCVVP